MIKPTRERKCISCKNKFKPNFNTQTACSMQCAIEYVKKQGEKKKSEIKRLEKEKLKKGVTGLPELKKLLETQINAICRLLDKETRCISCGGHTTPAAGHYHSVGSSPSIRFNLFNVHLQDFNCNNMRSGNLHQYDLGLIKIYGKEYWEYVKFELPKHYTVLKLTKSELYEAINKAKELVKRLKDANITHSAEQRIRLRSEYNRYIGIYTENNFNVYE